MNTSEQMTAIAKGMDGKRLRYVDLIGPGGNEVDLMAAPNFVNRTLWTGDNLDILRGLNSESIDLIYLDPPFNSNQDYAAPVGSKAAGAAFRTLGRFQTLTLRGWV